MLWEHPCQSTRSLLAPSVDGPMLSRSSPRRQLTAGSVSTSAPTIAWVQIWYYFKILFHSIFAKQIPFGADALHRLYLRFFFLAGHQWVKGAMRFLQIWRCIWGVPMAQCSCAGHGQSCSEHACRDRRECGDTWGTQEDRRYDWQAVSNLCNSAIHTDDGPVFNIRE